MKRNRIRLTSYATMKRNAQWKAICKARTEYLIERYGQIICEYSGETVRTLSSVPNDLEDAWGHHIDGNKNNCTPKNCYIVKYKYHLLIHNKGLRVKQLGFEGHYLDRVYKLVAVGRHD